jgi:hypothetical protein
VLAASILCYVLCGGRKQEEEEKTRQEKRRKRKEKEEGKKGEKKERNFFNLEISEKIKDTLRSSSKFIFVEERYLPNYK